MIKKCYKIINYSKAIELAPNYYFALVNRGSCYERLGKYKVALKDYEKALAYIRQHMEGGVGLWTETAVIEQLKNWKLSLMPPTPQPSIYNPSDEIGNENGGRVADESTPSERQNQAKEKIQSIATVDEAKRILDALCDLGLDSIFNIILK